MAAHPPTQQSTLPELPCVLWHKIFREVAVAEKSVETLARLRLVNKTTARDFEFKIFSEQIGRLFDDAAQKRKDAYQQWLQDNQDTEWTPHMRHSQTYGQIGALRGHNAGGVFAQLILYELAEESGALGDMWGKRHGRNARTQHGGMAQACIRAVKRAFSEARVNIRGY